MGRPYERIVDIVSDGTAYYAMDYPTKVGISKIRITGAKAGAFNAGVYTKAFSGSAQAIAWISRAPMALREDIEPVAGSRRVPFDPTLFGPNSATPAQGSFQTVMEGSVANNTLSTKTQIAFTAAHGLTVGDTVTVANSGVTAYNVAHIVTAILDPYRVATDQTYTVDTQGGGTGTMSIPSARIANYEFQTSKAADGDHCWRYDEPHGTPFVNQDPIVNNLPTQKIYFKFDVADTYRVTVMSMSDWYG